MKQHIKKLSVLFLLAALFASCDAEETYLKEKNSNNGIPVIKTLTYEQAGETFKRLKKELKIEKHLKIPENSDLQARTIKDTLGFQIEADIIKQVTLGDYTSYTMKIVKEDENTIFYNLTIEEKNGESNMYIIQYNPTEYWLNHKDQYFRGSVKSIKQNVLTVYDENALNELFDDLTGNNNNEVGSGPGGSSYNGSPDYPIGCDGIVIVSMQYVPYPCGCEGHMPWECGGCPTSPAGYDLVPYYYCQELPNYSGGGSSTGGSSSNNPINNTSITAMITPEVCNERIEGDLNHDCYLSPYEMCLKNGNSQEVCDCVKTSGNINICVSEIIEEQIDDDYLDDCTKQVLTNIKSLNQNDFARILAKFSPLNSVYKVTLIPDNTLPADDLGTTDWSGDILPIPYDYTIKLNQSFLVESTKLGMAATILHELLHAYFLSIVDDNYETGSTELENFPNLWNYYVLSQGNGANYEQHVTIANLYVKKLARALQEFHTGNPVLDSDEPLQIYKDLAWGGLNETPAYNALSIEERNRIIAVCNAENKNEPQTANGINYNPISDPCY